MKRRMGSCPACAGPVEFQLSTALVTICEFCHSVVARADKRLEDHGKVADLVETNSPLQRGMKGKFEKKQFEIVGRVQYRHPAGGVWDEWYLQFPEDRVGWLAEAQGKFYLMSRKKLDNEVPLPAYETLSPGHRIDLPGGKTLVVAEKGIATALSADGSIPWAFVPNAEHRFVDLHGSGKEFGTIEYDAGDVKLFLGREVSLEELDLSEANWEAQAYAIPNTKALQINCPHCAGPLTLHAPDQTQRVCCPSCRSLLDCQQGKLAYLQTLHMEVARPLIPLGSVGILFEVEYTVIGFMQRYAVYKGTKYPWNEYLLYNAKAGFRWIVENSRHWSFVESISVTAVNRSQKAATFNRTTFRIFDRGEAFVQYVAGEFYWPVSVDERVQTEDYIAPPQMLSFERTTTENGDELNVSLGTYLEKEVLEAAFKIKELPAAWGVGTIQPQPNRSDLWLLWLGFGLLLILLDFIFVSAGYKVDQFHFFMALSAVSFVPIIAILLRYNFEVSRWKDSDYSPYSQEESDD